jgi:hypothetical protein
MQVMPFAGVAMALVAFAGARRSLNEFIPTIRNRITMNG